MNCFFEFQALLKIVYFVNLDGTLNFIFFLHAIIETWQYFFS